MRLFKKKQQPAQQLPEFHEGIEIVKRLDDLDLAKKSFRKIWIDFTEGGDRIYRKFRTEPTDANSVPYIRADLAGQLGVETPQWKPIAEIPEKLKDGRNWLLGYDPNLEQPLAVRWIARYQHWCDIHSNGHVITHWMPLPTAPQAEAEEGE